MDVNFEPTLEEVKKAYKTKALGYHPDKNGGDKEAGEKFKELNTVYHELKEICGWT
jgi:molecular chaperone DnaJ